MAQREINERHKYTIWLLGFPNMNNRTEDMVTKTISLNVDEAGSKTERQCFVIISIKMKED